MLKIGITGGIGVGKTYVSNIIEKMGYPVFYADQTAKDLVKSDYKLIESIKKEFGHDFFLFDQVRAPAEPPLARLNARPSACQSGRLSVRLFIHPPIFLSGRRPCQGAVFEQFL